jgi:hypothetical protein
VLFNVKKPYKMLARVRTASKHSVRNARAMTDFRFIAFIVLRTPEHVFYAKITQIRGPEELKQPKMFYFGG